MTLISAIIDLLSHPIQNMYMCLCVHMILCIDVGIAL